MTRRVPLDGGEPEVLGFGFGRLSPDGRTRYYRRTVDDATQWVAVSIADGRERLIVNLAGRPGRNNDPTVVGSDYVYFGWGQRRTDIWVMDVVQDDGSDD